MIIHGAQNSVDCTCSFFARFNKAHKAFPSARFPTLIWDVLPKCGASQIHPHLQGFLDPERYHGIECVFCMVFTHSMHTQPNTHPAVGYCGRRN